VSDGAQLRPRSLAAIVLEAGREGSRARQSARARIADGGVATATSLAGIVLATAQPRPLAIALACVIAIGMHGAGAGWIARADPPPPVRRAPVMALEREVELVPPKSEPKPEPEPDTPPPIDPVAAPPVPTTTPQPTTPRPAARPAPAAQAAKVATADPPANDPSFAGFDMTQGDAPRYAGGTTASSGTSTTPGRGTATGTDDGDSPRPQPPAAGDRSRARPVRLAARDWDCPWPAQARDLSAVRQVVVLRVLVRADGRVSTADVLEDPGHGFGAAAEACARDTRFQPALDGAGKPYAATSPPVRVTFQRRTSASTDGAASRSTRHRDAPITPP
jgi:protein TonB